MTQLAKTIQSKFGFEDADLKTPQHDKIMLWLDEYVDEYLHGFYLNRWMQDDYLICGLEFPGIGRVDKTWEYPVVSGGKFTVGFVDMRCRIDKPRWHSERVWTESIEICFEVKAVLPSLGELIRQIRMYKTYIQSPFVVVSPDNRYEKTLLEQGIRFLQYTEVAP